MKEKYGNYVVQFIIQLRDPEINRKIVVSILDEIVILSKLKFSSNVIEKVYNMKTLILFNNISFSNVAMKTL